MTPLEAMASGAVQGVTEFFPISSSGHLVILHHLFGFKSPQLFFDLLLHLGTLVAILVSFRKEVVSLLTKEGRMLGLVLVGILPTAAIGIFFGKSIEGLFQSPRAVSTAFLVTAAWLLAAGLRRGDPKPLTVWRALIIGASQGIALIPGISRIGATLATGLLLGLLPEEALLFSFFLAIPTIAGAFTYHVLAQHPQGAWGGMETWLGFATSVVVGLLAIAILRRFIVKGKLYVFSLYLAVLGVSGLIYF